MRSQKLLTLTREFGRLYSIITTKTILSIKVSHANKLGFNLNWTCSSPFKRQR